VSIRGLSRRLSVKMLAATNRVTRLADLKLIPANLVTEEWFSQVGYFSRLLERVRNIEGDVVECGVASGRSLAIIASLVRSSGTERRIWGFDSWRGLPSLSSEDAGSVDGEGAFSSATVDEVRLRLELFGFDSMEGITLVEGDITQTLATAAIDRIAFLHLDVDIYESYRSGLTILWPKVASGGIVALDEYADPAWPGATQAVDEFMATLPEGEAQLESDRRFRGRHYIVKG
jgi:Macrocin-O-methyltransferase (TylF)